MRAEKIGQKMTATCAVGLSLSLCSACNSMPVATKTKLPGIRETMALKGVSINQIRVHLLDFSNAGQSFSLDNLIVTPVSDDDNFKSAYGALITIGNSASEHREVLEKDEVVQLSKEFDQLGGFIKSADSKEISELRFYVNNDPPVEFVASVPQNGTPSMAISCGDASLLVEGKSEMAKVVSAICNGLKTAIEVIKEGEKKQEPKPSSSLPPLGPS